MKNTRKKQKKLKWKNEEFERGISLINGRVKHLECLEWKWEKQEKERKKNKIITTGRIIEE